MQYFTTMLALVILQQSGITSIIQHVFLRVCQERSREVGSHWDALEHIMISLLNAPFPHGEPLFFWPSMAVRHIMQTAEGLQTCKQTHVPAAAGLREHPGFFLFHAIGAGPIFPHHALSVSGDCESFPLVPHPTVRNNLQHCWALCHLTLHGQNTQPLEGLNRGLCAWKQWSSNHHIWLIKLNLFSATTLFSLLSRFLQ